jgi:hypothetical protein
VDAIVEKVNSAAIVLGYPVLIFVFLVLAWACAMAVQGINKTFMIMQYDRQKRKNAERERDNLEASWMLTPDEDPDVSFEDHYATQDYSDLPEQLYDYQEERRYDGS